MKKAQVTLFIILGIVILVAGALVFYYKERVSLQPEFVEPRFEPVKKFVQTCIDDISEEAVTTLGLNGGYITFPDTVRINPNSYLSAGPIKEFRNPYWWYDGIDAIPTEDFIRKQIADYVTEQLEICVEGFSSFEDQFDVEQGDIKTDVALTEENVLIQIKFPLVIRDKSDASEAEISNFVKVVPVRLKKAYELAKSIMEKENQDRFLEKKTIDLIALDESIPDTDVELTCNRKRWEIIELKEKLQELLAVNLPYIRISGTSYKDTYVPSPYGSTKYSESYYQQHYIWDVTEKNNQGMHVSFGYDKTYPMKFYVRPNKGSYIESNAQKGFNMLSFFCIHIWHFTYDVVYPVRVAIHDEETANHDAYTFIFAFKVSVDHNQPLRENFATTIFEGIGSGNNEEFCNNVDKLMHITTWDNVTDDPIPDVNLTFTCGIYSCDTGKTEWMGFGAAAGLNKRMPYCVYGILRGKAANYDDKEMFIQTDKARSYEMYMIPIKLIDDVEVVKHKYRDGVIGQEEPLAPEEKASIMISMVNSSFSSYAAYPLEGYPLKLLAGEDYTYQLLVYLIDNEEMTGGYVADWTVSWWELEEADKLKIHVLEQYPKPTDENEKYLFIGGLASYSEKVDEPELLIK